MTAKKLLLLLLICLSAAIFSACKYLEVVDEWPTEPVKPTRTARPVTPTSPLPNPTLTLVPTATGPFLASPTAPSTNPDAPDNLPVEPERPALAARQDLAARLGLLEDAIQVVDAAAQDWPDDCLGLAPAVGQACKKGSVPGQRLLLAAAGRGYEYRLAGSQLVYSGPISIDAPEVCRQPGTSSFYNPGDGYCLAYPLRFHRPDDPPATIDGPSYGYQPFFTRLSLEISPLTAGQDLDNAVETYLSKFSASTNPPATPRQSLTVAGQPARQVEGAPGREAVRDLFLVKGDKLFHLAFSPLPSVVIKTASDLEELYQVVLGSFYFTP